jgi:hypothetical protein
MMDCCEQGNEHSCSINVRISWIAERNVAFSRTMFYGVSFCQVGFLVLTEMSMKLTAFWDIPDGFHR